MNMNNNELQSRVLVWAGEKNILKPENVKQQFIKTVSEVGELGDAIIKNNREEIIDGLGDVQVTLIILAEQLGLSDDECLESACNVIKNRTGKTVGGTFIKD